MALSNWDTLAFGEDGQSCPGEFGLRGDAVLEIYKNWIYIRQPSAWFEGNGYTGNVVMQIESGRVRYAGCEITMERTPLQSGFFVFVSDHDYTARTTRFFAGIGCSAYLTTIEWMRRNDPERLKLLPEGWEGMEYLEGSHHGPDGEFEVVSFLRDDGPLDINLYPYDERPDTYVGVMPETYAAFLSWLGEIVEDQVGDEATVWFSRVRVSRTLMYNQGDAYFAGHLGREIPAVAVGDGPPPTVMTQVLDEMGR